jgi:hypothetical protein
MSYFNGNSCKHTLVEVIVAFDCGATDVAEHGAASLAHHLVASRFLDTSLCALGALSDERFAHGFLDCVSMVERIVLGS